MTLCAWRLARLEVLRLAMSRRWLLAVVTCALVGFLSTDHVLAEARNTGAAASALDVHAAALNNLMYLGYLIFTALVFLAGDTVVDDVTSRYGWMVLSRSDGRASWWWAKVVSLLCGALCLQLMLFAACVGIGHLRGGLTTTIAASELASLPAKEHGLALFPPVAAGTNMLARQLARIAYTAFATAALATVLVSLSVRTGKGRLPMSAALIGLMADYVLVKAWEPWRVASPGTRLLEGSHVAFAGAPGLNWFSSILYFSTALMLGVMLGLRWMRRADW